MSQKWSSYLKFTLTGLEPMTIAVLILHLILHQFIKLSAIEQFQLTKIPKSDKMPLKLLSIQKRNLYPEKKLKRISSRCQQFN